MIARHSSLSVIVLATLSYTIHSLGREGLHTSVVVLLGSDALASTLGVLVTWVLGEVLLFIVTGTVGVIILVSTLGLLVTWELGKVLLSIVTGTAWVIILVRGLLVLLVTELEEELS